MPQTIVISQALKRTRGGRKAGTFHRRIESLTAEITEHAAKLSNTKSVFGDEAAQKTEVAKRQQAIVDVVKRSLATHAAVERKNLDTTVKTSMGDFTLADLVRLKNKYLAYWQGAYAAPKQALKRAQMDARGLTSSQNPVTVEPMFDERERVEMVQKLRAFEEEIDELLDEVNNDKANHAITIPD
jgi:hypothetical protein